MNRNLIKVSIWLAGGAFSTYMAYQYLGLTMDEAKGYMWGLVAGLLSNFVEE